MLRLKDEHLDAMRAHGAQCYPNECIGILGGTVGSDRGDDADKTVLEVRPVDNVFDGPHHNRSAIAPREFLRIDREYRAKGWKMVGFYHSHPDHPCKPSDFDRDNALPWASYVIVKVDQGKPVDVTSWVLQEDRGGFDPEEIKVS